MNKSYIKNYTSTSPVLNSISKIERILVEMGASDILKKYKEGILDSICFQINVNNQNIPVKLSAQIDKIYNVLKSEVKRPRENTFQIIKEQAERTAWKLQCEWLEIQRSLFLMEQKEFIELFLSNIYDFKNDETYYQKIQKDPVKYLPQVT